MISAEAPVLFAKACELFVLDITTRCWANSAEERATRKRVLTREAVLATVQRTVRRCAAGGAGRAACDATRPLQPSFC